VLVGLDINPTFTNGAFTGVSNYGLRVGGATGLVYDITNTKLNIGGSISSFTQPSTINIVGSTTIVGATARNTSSATGSTQAGFYVENGSSNGQLYKAGTNYTAYKTISANDLGFYNGAFSGNISILNDYSSGNINITAGGLSNPQLTLQANGNILHSKNQNAQTIFNISNTTSGTASQATLNTTSSNGAFSVGKSSATTTAYKTTLANDAFLYNITSGNISILNDFSTGNINFTAGGASTAQATLFSTGNLAIGSTTDAGYKLDVTGTSRHNGQTTLTGSVTAASALAQGIIATPTLVAAANSDTLTGIYISPTFVKGAFTGVINQYAQYGNEFLFTANDGTNPPTLTIYNATYGGKLLLGYGSISVGSSALNIQTTGSQDINFLTSGVQKLKIYNSGNIVLQNGGTFTDAGFKLDINGTSRTQGTSGFGILATPAQPTGTPVLSGGTLADGTYYYQIVAVDAFGNTTIGGTERSVVLSGGGGLGSISLTWTATTNATSYRIYRGTASAGENVYYTSATNSYTDINAASTAGTLPTVNTTYLTQIASTGTINTLTVGLGGGAIASNTAIGYQAINGTATGGNNVAIGYQAGKAITTGSQNTFVGYQAGLLVTTGGNNTIMGLLAGSSIVSGTGNSFFGLASGNVNTANNNSFFGTSSGAANTTASGNTFFGFQAGTTNTTGASNTFVGSGAGKLNTTNGSNTFIGSGSGNTNTGSSNSFVGLNSGYFNTTGGNNVFFGYQSAQQNTTGSNNIAIGYNSGNTIADNSTGMTIANNSILIGYNTHALADNQTNQTVIGYNQTGLGSNTTILGGVGNTTTAIVGNLLLGSTTDNGTDKLQVTGSAKVTSTLTLLPSDGTAFTAFGGAVTLTQSGGTRLLNLMNGSIQYNSSYIFAIGTNIGLSANTGLLLSGDATIYLGNGAGYGLQGIQGTSLYTLRKGLASGSVQQNFDLTTADYTYSIYGAVPSGNVRLYSGDNTGTGGGGFGAVILQHNGTVKRGNVLIGTSTDLPSAILQVTSTTQGVLFPRMTTTQRDAIATPATGLQVYNTTTNTNDFYNGTAWVNGTGSSGTSGQIAYFNASNSLTSSSTLAYTPTSALTLTGSITAASAIARGEYNNTTLVAAANNDVLVGLDIAPTFTNGAFTGVKNLGLRVGGATGLNYDVANQRLGIGTASPLTSLDVSGNARIAGVIITGNPAIPAGTGAALTEGYYAVGGYAFFQGYNYTTSAYIPVYVDGSALYLNLNSGGNVGIATTTVGSKLQVNGNAAIGYSASTAAPTNGLVVSGTTLIGSTTDNGTDKLQVTGTTIITATGNALKLSSGARVYWANREVSIGEGTSSVSEGIAIGWTNTANIAGAILIGKNISSSVPSFAAVHPSGTITLTGNYTINILANNTTGIAIGNSAVTDNSDINSTAIAIGALTTSTGGIEGSIAIGRTTSATGTWSIALGAYSEATTSEFVAGSRGKPISNVYFGSGNLSTSRGVGIGSAYTINGSGASGTDFAGGNITIAGGKGTGAGAAGDVIFSTATTSTTGTTLQTLTNRWWIKGTTGQLSNVTSPNASAAFQVDATTQGVLLPRMTTTQKLAISSPAEGLHVYDLTLHQMSYYNGTVWINF
jgi:hypothetical protein